jgi:hypothetical protein
MDGGGVSILAGERGVVVICPFLFAALALVDRGDRLGVSISNGCEPFCAALAPLFKDAVSISREKGAAGWRSLVVVYVGCGNSIG